MKEQLGQLKVMCGETGRDFDALDITVIVPAINVGVGERPPFFKGLQEDPKSAKELVAEYEDAGVNRIIVGLEDMTDEASFRRIEDAARGLGLRGAR